ncbi:MAG: nitroreductase [Acidobacteriota bacterium]
MIEHLLSRASTGNLNEPGPDEAALRLILEAAVRAPDHGKLRPWRFHVVRGEARRRLSDLFVECFLRREPNSSPAQIEKERGKPLRAPLTVMVVAKVVEGHKVPVIEQVVSAGAAAMNILNAAHALGYGAKWVTGANCYDPFFLGKMGLDPADQVVGFIQIGSISETVEAPRPDAMSFAVEFR